MAVTDSATSHLGAGDLRSPLERLGSEKELVTVVLGCFETLVGRGLADVLREDRRVKVLSSELDSASVELSIARDTPRVAILDEPANGSTITRLRSLDTSTGLLVLAAEPRRAYGMVLLAAGVACLARDAAPQRILETVHLVANGGCVFGAADGHAERYDSPLLSDRELEVLWQLAVHGRSQHRAARALQINLRTVQTYSARACKKLKVSSPRALMVG